MPPPARKPRITLERSALAQALALSAADVDPALIEVKVAFTCRRRGVETKIVAGDPEPVPDPTLIRALRQAHLWSEALRSGTRLVEAADAAGHGPRYLARMIPLAFLSPRIQKALLEGRQPAALTLATLMRTDLPLDWSDQERKLGVAA